MFKILLLTLVSTVMFADTGYMFHVDNPTMAKAYFDIFNAIGGLMQSEMYMSILKLIFALGVFFVFIMGIFKLLQGGDAKSSLTATAKYLIAGAMLMLLVLPTDSNKKVLIVESKEIPTYYCSDENANNNYSGFTVSMSESIAFLFSSMNSIGYGTTELASTAFSSVSTSVDIGKSFNEMSRNGFGGGIASTKDLLQINFTEDISADYAAKTQDSSTFGNISNGEILTSYASSFMRDCVYMVGSSNSKVATEMLHSMERTSNIFKTLDNIFVNDVITIFSELNGSTISSEIALDSASNVPSRLLFGTTDANGIENFGTCGKFWTEMFKPALAGIENDNIMCVHTNITPAGLYLMTGNGDSATPAVANEIAVNQALINLSKSNSNNPISKDMAYASGKSQAEFILNNVGTGTYMAEMLPYLQMGIRAVLYAFFPFVFLVILLPGGFGVAKNYAQTMIWVELWSPVAAILNLFLSYFQMDKMSGTYNLGLNAINSSSLVTDSNMLASVAGYLYMSVPALTFLILKGSAEMLGSISSGMAGGFARNMDSGAIRTDMSNIEKTNEFNKANGSKLTMSATMLGLEKLDAGIQGASLGKAIAQSGGIEGYKEGMSNSKAQQDIKQISHANNSTMNVQKASGAGQAIQEVNTLTATGVIDKNGNVDMNKIKEIEAAQGAEKASEIKKTAENMSHMAKKIGADLNTVDGRRQVAQVMSDSKSAKFKGGVAEQESEARQYALVNGTKINGKAPSEATFEETVKYSETAKQDIGTQKGVSTVVENEQKEAIHMTQGKASGAIHSKEDIENFTGTKMVESKTVKSKGGNEFIVARSENGTVFTTQKGRALRALTETIGRGEASKEVFNKIKDGQDLDLNGSVKVTTKGLQNELNKNAAYQETVKRKTESLNRKTNSAEDIASDKSSQQSKSISAMKQTTQEVFANDSKKVALDKLDSDGNVVKTDMQTEAVRDTVSLMSGDKTEEEVNEITSQIMETKDVNKALNAYGAGQNHSQAEIDSMKNISAQRQMGRQAAKSDVWKNKSDEGYRQELAKAGMDYHVEAVNRAFGVGSASVIPEQLAKAGVSSVDAGKYMGALVAAQKLMSTGSLLGKGFQGGKDLLKGLDKKKFKQLFDSLQSIGKK